MGDQRNILQVARWWWRTPAGPHYGSDPVVSALWLLTPLIFATFLQVRKWWHWPNICTSMVTSGTWNSASVSREMRPWGNQGGGGHILCWIETSSLGCSFHVDRKPSVFPHLLSASMREASGFWWGRAVHSNSSLSYPGCFNLYPVFVSKVLGENAVLKQMSLEANRGGTRAFGAQRSLTGN